MRDTREGAFHVRGAPVAIAATRRLRVAPRQRARIVARQGERTLAQ